MTLQLVLLISYLSLKAQFFCIFKGLKMNKIQIRANYQKIISYFLGPNYILPPSL